MSRIEDVVCQKIQLRAAIGKEKYGTTMRRVDLTDLQWLTHAQEEAMDLAIYLQKLIESDIFNKITRKEDNKMTKFKRKFYSADGTQIRRKDYLDNAYAECRGDRDVFISAYENSDLRFFASTGEEKKLMLLRRNAIGAFNKLDK